MNNAETKVDVDGFVLYLLPILLRFCFFLDDFFRAFVSSATNFVERRNKGRLSWGDGDLQMHKKKKVKP